MKHKLLTIGVGNTILLSSIVLALGTWKLVTKLQDSSCFEVC
jgi:hypothetical protein